MVSMIAEQLSKKYIKVFLFSAFYFLILLSLHELIMYVPSQVSSKKIQKRFYKSTKTSSILCCKNA